MKYYIITIFFAMLLFTACKKKSEDDPAPDHYKICSCGPPPTSKYFVESYLVAGGLKVVDSKNPYFIPMYITAQKSYNYSANLNDSFYVYANMYHDYEYTKGSNAIVVIDTIDTITINTKYDIDSNHLAGSQVNDLFTIGYSTVFDFIQSRYKAPHPTEIISSIQI